MLGIIGSPSTALQLLHEGLTDGGVYAIVIDYSMHPKHMAAIEATAASLPNVLLNLVDSNSIGPLRAFHFQHATKKAITTMMPVREEDQHMYEDQIIDFTFSAEPLYLLSLLCKEPLLND